MNTGNVVLDIEDLIYRILDLKEMVRNHPNDRKRHVTAKHQVERAKDNLRKSLQEDK